MKCCDCENTINWNKIGIKSHQCSLTIMTIMIIVMKITVRDNDYDNNNNDDDDDDDDGNNAW